MPADVRPPLSIFLVWESQDLKAIARFTGPLPIPEFRRPWHARRSNAL
jgi:hypothetical protein